MGGLGTAHSESLYQNVSIPASAQSATLSLWLNITTDETTTTNAYDKLYVQIRNPNGAVLKTLATYSNLDETLGYVQKTFDVSVFRGRPSRSSSEWWRITARPLRSGSMTLR